MCHALPDIRIFFLWRAMEVGRGKDVSLLLIRTARHLVHKGKGYESIRISFWAVVLILSSEGKSASFRGPGP